MKVNEPVKYLKNSTPKPFVSEEEEEEKWTTRNYSLKKIGVDT